MILYSDFWEVCIIFPKITLTHRKTKEEKLICSDVWKFRKTFISLVQDLKLYVKEALVSSATFGEVEVTNLLLENFKNPDSLNKALRSASSNGYTNIMELLIKHGANVIESDCMLAAIERSKIGAVKYLRERYEFDDRVLLTYACENHCFGLVKYFIETGAEIDFIRNMVSISSRLKKEILEYLGMYC